MIKDEFKEILDFLNEEYSQESENYSIFYGTKPEVIRYNEHIAISFWACGAIVCRYDLLFFICEDDGSWYVCESDEVFVTQTTFSIGWLDSFVKALNSLKKYVEDNGTPVYYSGTDIICHYTL